MLKEIYDIKREEIDNVIKNAIKNIEPKLYKIEDKEIDKKLEENYNIKLAAIAEELYIKGLKDGINLILECKNEKEVL